MAGRKIGKWQRRSAERPGEIAGAALIEFAAHGFAGARLSDIAVRAGVTKAALYRYYPTKTDLFRAVLAARAQPPLAEALTATGATGAPLSQVLELTLSAVATAIERPELRRLARTVLAESGNFPQLASLWHESIVEPAVGALTCLITRAQAAGEARAGDPRLMAFSIMGPMLLAVLWREIIEPAGGAPLDFSALASEHRTTLLHGLLRDPARNEHA